MFQESNLDGDYKSWVDSAHQLDPPYNYFLFADLINKDKNITNTVYHGLMLSLIESSNKFLEERLSAIKRFEVIKNQCNSLAIFLTCFLSDTCKEKLKFSHRI